MRRQSPSAAISATYHHRGPAAKWAWFQLDPLVRVRWRREVRVSCYHFNSFPGVSRPTNQSTPLHFVPLDVPQKRGTPVISSVGPHKPLCSVQPPSQVTVFSPRQPLPSCGAWLINVRSPISARAARRRTAGRSFSASIHRQRPPPCLSLRSTAVECASSLRYAPSFLSLRAVPPCAMLAPSLTRHRSLSLSCPSSRTLKRPTRQSTGRRISGALFTQPASRGAGYFYVSPHQLRPFLRFWRGMLKPPCLLLLRLVIAKVPVFIGFQADVLFHLPSSLCRRFSVRRLILSSSAFRIIASVRCLLRGTFACSVVSRLRLC